MEGYRGRVAPAVMSSLRSARGHDCRDAGGHERLPFCWTFNGKAGVCLLEWMGEEE